MLNRNSVLLSAEEHYLEAQRLRARGGYQEAIACYTKAIQTLLNMADKTDKDKRTIAHWCHNLANTYFNNGDHSNAAKYYLEGTISLQTILNTSLTDEDYRDFTKLYIDLSDAYSHLFNHEAATHAFTTAIHAFSFIQHKTEGEQTIGDASVNQVLFRNFFEKQLSSPSYCASTEYSNHGQVLASRYAEEQATAGLLDGLNSLLTSDVARLTDDFGTLLGSPPQSAAVFTAMPTPPTALEDDDYRSSAMSLMRVSQQYVNRGSIQQAKETLQQVNAALGQIKEKTPTDSQMIAHVSQSILTLFRSTPSTQGTLSSMSIHTAAREAPARDFDDSYDHRDYMQP